MIKYNNLTSLRKLTYSALFLALALVLPFLTGQIPTIGTFISPMHSPAMLCGLICGPLCGAVVGFVSPLLRFVMFSMPPIMVGIPMSVELAVYGSVSAIVYCAIKPKIGKISIYISLAVSMIAGRLMYTAVKILMLGIADGNVNPSAFLVVFAQSFSDTWLGIIIQFLIIPPLVMAAEAYFRKNKAL